MTSEIKKIKRAVYVAVALLAIILLVNVTELHVRFGPRDQSVRNIYQQEGDLTNCLIKQNEEAKALAAQTNLSASQPPVMRYSKGVSPEKLPITFVSSADLGLGNIPGAPDMLRIQNNTGKVIKIYWSGWDGTNLAQYFDRTFIIESGKDVAIDCKAKDSLKVYDGEKLLLESLEPAPAK